MEKKTRNRKCMSFAERHAIGKFLEARDWSQHTASEVAALVSRELKLYVDAKAIKYFADQLKIPIKVGRYTRMFPQIKSDLAWEHCLAVLEELCGPEHPRVVAIRHALGGSDVNNGN